MMKRIVFLSLAAIVACGCQPEHMAPVPRPPETEQERNFEELWQASRRTLRDRRFEVDRQDRRYGTMTTRATTSSHGLEQLWRGDAVTQFGRSENTIQTILRAVRVTVRPVEGTDQYDVQVSVRMARVNRPPRELTDASQVGGGKMPLPPLTYADLGPQPAMPGRRSRGPITIVPLGEDGDLAFVIEDEIRTRAGLAPRPLEPPPTESPASRPTTAPADGLDGLDLPTVAPPAPEGARPLVLPTPTTAPAPIEPIPAEELHRPEPVERGAE